MELLLASFVAGILTILAPCILPVIPIIVGGAVREGETRSWRRPLVIISSLSISIIVFTLLLRASTVFIDIPEQSWRNISGFIIVLFGITMVWPRLWEQLSLKLGLANASNRLLAKASTKKGLFGDILIGSALGPVFISCSPTYALILATVLPVSLGQGLIYLVVYALGLSLMLLATVWLGNKLIHKLGWATDPESRFRKILGSVFILLGMVIIMGWDKDLQAWLIEQGLYDPLAEIERSLVD